MKGCSGSFRASGSLAAAAALYSMLESGLKQWFYSPKNVRCTNSLLDIKPVVKSRSAVINNPSKQQHVDSVFLLLR